MSKRKKRNVDYSPQDWENGGANQKKYARIFNNMMQTEAWKALTPWQRVIYLHLKSFYNGKTKKITTTTRQIADAVGCTKNTASTGLRKLEQYGFIELVSAGGLGRVPSIYQFSSKWVTINAEIVREQGIERAKIKKSIND